jgi:ligand-binding sensor domain-containing protein
MKYFAAIFFAILAVFSTATSGFAQSFDYRVGEWKTHLSHEYAIQMAERQGVLYCITQGGLFTYNLQTQETQTYSTVNQLSGVTPTAIFYHKASDLIFIGYEDGKIDYFQTPDNIQNLTDLYRNEFYTQKNILAFTGEGDLLFVATPFGMVVYDLKNVLPKFTITQIADNPVRTSIISVCTFQQRIWAVVEGKGIYSAALNAVNLSDPSIWRKEDSGTGIAIGNYKQIIAGSDKIYALKANGSEIYKQENNVWALWKTGGFGEIFLNDEILSINNVNFIEVLPPNGATQNLPFTGEIRDVWVKGTSIFTANIYFGVEKNDNGTKQHISPNGPASNDCVKMVAGNGELYVAPKGYTTDWTSAYNGVGTFYHTNANGWKVLNREQKTLPDNAPTTDFARAYYDKNTQTAYIGSWGNGVLALKNGEYQKHYTCQNSAISYIYQDPITQNCTAALDNTRVSGMMMDGEGTLWLSFAYAQNHLMGLTADGVFHKTNQSLLFPSNSEQVIDLEVDDYGGKWLLYRNEGIMVYYDKGTLDNLADDFVIFLRAGKGQGDLPSGNGVYSLAKDLEGNMWIGTDQGIRIMYSSYIYEMSKGKSQDVIAPIYEGYALLRTDLVSAIAVDGGNRKWLGTQKGIYVVDSDGENVLYRFTKENSPLLSDVVSSIAIDQSSGEVFIGTNKGIISYRGTSTAAAEKCADVLVFPNPVFTDYSGMVSFQGSVANSKVRITNISGVLVREVQSEGGMAVWDGKDMWGNRVSSGVYLAMISDKNGANACVGKFSVIER